MASEDVTGLHVVIVGCGVLGVRSGLTLARKGARVTILDREAGVGGVWRTFANAGSRVQVSEPGYRLIPERPLTDLTHKPEVLSTLEDALAMIRKAGGQVLYGADVHSVRNTGSAVDIGYKRSGVEERLVADHAMLCVGGLQVPRAISLPEEHAFKGPVVNGTGGEIDKVDVKGKHVLMLGMGAFAIENTRECLFRGAEHVTILTRNRNQIIAQLWMYMGFVQKLDFMPNRELEKLRAVAEKQAKAKGLPPMMGPDIMATMLDAYAKCNAQDAMPTEFHTYMQTKNPFDLQRFRESQGTIPTGSDAFFIGHALGKLITVRDEVGRVLADGVETKSGRKIQADIIVKNFGFEKPDAWLKSVVGQTHMHSPIVINDRVWLCKLERNTLSMAELKAIGREALGDVLNVPAVAPALADVFVELFCYFQARPQKLHALLNSGRVPHVEIGQCTFLTWSRGQWAMMESDPELAKRLNACRHQISIDMAARWSFSEYFRENKAAWQLTCKRMSGDEQSVPYLWDHMEGVFEMIDQMQQQKQASVPTSLPQQSRL